MNSFLPEKLQNLVLQKKVLIAVLAANLAGTLFGFYYYIPQFQRAPFYLWILVADSPIATLAIAISLVLHLENKSNAWIDCFAFVANIKYGLWTVFVLIYYSPVFWAQNSPPLYLFLLVSHFLMFLQALVITEYSIFDLKSAFLVASWFIFNDIADYSLDIHSCLSTSCNHPDFMAMIAAFLTTLIALFFVAMTIDKESDL